MDLRVFQPENVFERAGKGTNHEAHRDLIVDEFVCVPVGEDEATGRGLIEAWFVEDRQQ